jgi:hypothetical protein
MRIGYATQEVNVNSFDMPINRRFKRTQLQLAQSIAIPRIAKRTIWLREGGRMLSIRYHKISFLPT